MPRPGSEDVVHHATSRKGDRTTSAMESTTYRGSASAYQRRPRASGATHLFEFHFLETKSSISVSSKKRAVRIWPASRAEK